MTWAVSGTSSRPARTESARCRPPSAMSSGLVSSKTRSSFAKRTVCEGCRTTTRPLTSGMASSRRTECERTGSPPSSRNCFDSPSGSPIRRLSPAAATITHTSRCAPLLVHLSLTDDNLLKIILPDGLCSTLVTSALTRSPTREAPASTTIMVPSSR